MMYLVKALAVSIMSLLPPQGTYLIHSHLTKDQAVMMAADQIPALRNLHTAVYSLSDWEKEHNQKMVRARLENGLSVVLEYDEDAGPEGGIITAIRIRSF